MCCMCVISNGRSSILSVSMLKASFMPQAYQNLGIASRFKRTVSSILELEGLGKEIWEGVDVEKYIEEERKSWERE